MCMEKSITFEHALLWDILKKLRGGGNGSLGGMGYFATVYLGFSEYHTLCRHVEYDDAFVTS